MSGGRAWIVVPLLLCLAACAGLPRAEYGVARPPGIPERAELTDVPFHPQEENQCGPAALATVLDGIGIPRSPQDLTDEVYLPQRQGSLQLEMLAATRRAGVLAYLLEPQFDALLREIAAGHPVVVLENLRLDILPQWHYAVVVGYDLGTDSIVLRSGRERRLVTAFTDFDRAWAKAGRWAFVALPPDRLPATAHESDFVAAAIALERTAPDAARTAYQTALAAWPKNLIARIASGNIAYRRHRLSDAESEYRRATLDHPDAADAWNNLAQVLHETGKRREAREAAQRAVTIGGPRRAIYESTLITIEAAMAF